MPHAEAEKLAREAATAGFGKKRMGELFSKQMLAATVLAMILWFVSSYTFLRLHPMDAYLPYQEHGLFVNQGLLVHANLRLGRHGYAWAGGRLCIRCPLVGVRRLYFVCWPMRLRACCSCGSAAGGFYRCTGSPLRCPRSSTSTRRPCSSPAFKGSGLGLSSAVGRVAQFVAPIAIGLVAAGEWPPWRDLR